MSHLFFDNHKEPEEWEVHWKDMPEYVQKKKEPYAQIIFRFESEEDLQDFAKLIGQKLSKKTKSAWHPFKSHWNDITKVWVQGQDE